MPYTQPVEQPDGSLKDVTKDTLPERIEKDVNAIRQAVIGILIVVVVIVLLLLRG
jgi:hypothetical protein